VEDAFDGHGAGGDLGVGCRWKGGGVAHRLRCFAAEVYGGAWGRHWRRPRLSGAIGRSGQLGWQRGVAVKYTYIQFSFNTFFGHFGEFLGGWW
jgi:hypothetical protein